MKPTSTRSRIYVLSPILLILFFAFFLKPVSAQSNPPSSITFKLVKQPCNNDGILVASDSGAIVPVTFTWTESGKQTIVHTDTTTSDTLYNYNGGPVYVTTGTSPSQVYGYYAGSPPFTDSIATTGAYCPALGTAKATIHGGYPPFIIQWLNSSNNVVATGNPVSLPAGSYGYFITDSVGCTAGSYSATGITGGSGNNQEGSVYIANNTPVKDTVSATPANCTNGTATVSKVSGGKAPYSYLWSNGATTPTITGLSGGTYLVTVTDSLGCYLSSYAAVRQSVTVTVHTTPTNATCLQNDGSDIAFGSGGVSPYTYLWSNGQQTQAISGLVAGYYYVTVTDANHCTGTYYTNITAATSVSVTYTATPSSCTTGTGSASLNITGGTVPYTVNWGTYPAQTGATASALINGTYNFKVTDSVGCIRTGTVYVPPVSVVTGALFETDATCTQANGTAKAELNTGSAPFTYAWSNNATTSSISGLTAGGYTCTITDSKQCSITKYTVVHAATPIAIALNPVEASCKFNSDGSIAANVTGGTSPYSYFWSNGQTTATDTGLSSGYYSIYVQDSVGCTQSTWTNLGYNPYNNSCYCTLTGHVFLDTNTTCIYDSTKPGIQNILVHASGLGYSFTDPNGVYTILAPNGTYTLSENVQYYYPLSPCEQSNSVTVNVTADSGCVITNNFANVINPIHDVKICTISLNNPPVVGYNYTQRIVVQNNGTATEPGIVMGYATDGQLTFSSVTPSLFIQQDPGSAPDWYSIIDSFPSLAPGAKQTFDVSFDVPANIPLGTTVDFKDTVAYTSPISNWLADYTPWDNVNEYKTVTVGSFDPNEKEVSPIGTGEPGYITDYDSILTYTVRFQNTGTYQAFNVVVYDSLSPNVDFTTLRPGYSNYSYTADLSENGVAKFTFANINLPDSSTYPAASTCVLTYSVHQKPNLTEGTVIASAAKVVFDFNAPVATNAPKNTITYATALPAVQQAALGFNVYPNPASTHVYIVANIGETTNASTLKLYDIVGEQVLSQSLGLVKGKNQFTVDVSTLPSGLYFIEISDGQNTQTQKVSVIR